jgi:vacuolar iron transporter family protein
MAFKSAVTGASSFVSVEAMNAKDLKSLRLSWASEMQSAYLYDEVSRVEKNENCKRLFSHLAVAAREQAMVWEKSITEKAPGSLLNYRPDLRTQIVKHLISFLGPKAIEPVLASMKLRGLSVYSTHLASHDTPSTETEQLHRFSSTGGNLRAAVFGANDGLVSNACLILGVAGASQDPKVILLSGVSGLLAGAFSMAAGEYTSVRSQKELLEYQISLEKKELELYPEEEAKELSLIYEAKGVPPDEAARLSQRIFTDPEKALDTLAREELGLNPNELGSPWQAALSSFGAFAIGAIIPLLPLLLGASLIYSIVLTAFTLFALGVVLSLFTGRGALIGGVRMLSIGAAAAFVTHTIGRWVG